METKIGARFAAAVGAVLTVASLAGCATNGSRADEDNVLRDGAKEATSTVKDTKKTVDSVTQGVNALDKLGKSLKKFGF